MENWLKESDKNQKVYEVIRRSESFQRWLQYKEIDLSHEWESVYRVIQQRKRKELVNSVLKVAASLLFLLFIGGTLYFFTHQREVQPMVHSQVMEITPGGSKALLLLDDGRSIALEAPGDIEIREKDGTVIYKRDDRLDYSSEATPGGSDLLFNTIVIPRGGEFNLVLSDGTKVYLNSMSEFKYPVCFHEKYRKVQMKGEAYFDVASSEVPFIISCGGVDIEVMGTSFNVQGYEHSESIVTTLVEGRVRIAGDEITGEEVFLLPEEQAVYRRDEGSIQVKKVDPTIYTAWKDGKLVFQNSTLSEMMVTLSRWYNIDVIHVDSAVRDLRFSGSLDKYGEIRPILEIIEATRKVRIDVNGTEITFRERI